MTTLLDNAIAMLNAESMRLFGEQLDAEQVEAVFDEDQVFPMLDDMEARMGFNVHDPRIMITRHYHGGER